MKKVVSIVLILALFMSITSIQVFADTNTTITSGDYVYALDSGNNATIYNYIGSGGDVTIPSTLDGHTVTAIGEGAFHAIDSLTSVTIPGSVTTIGDNAFYSCGSLTSVTIPGSITSIGNYDFCYSTSLASVTIPSSVTSIGIGAFASCTSLASVTILNSAASIGNDAFNGTPWLASNNTFVVDGNGVLTKYNGTGGDVIIPSNVKSIAAGAFFNCTTLTSVTIPEGVTSITDGLDGGTPGAFCTCTGLKSVKIPNSMTYIGSCAFEQCTSLKSINLPSGITSINQSTFSGCESLTSIAIPNSVTTIGNSAFASCGLTAVTIPGSVTSIDVKAFDGCEGLTEIKIPSSVASIGESAFAQCDNLTAINAESNNPNYSSDDGVLFNKDKTTLIQYPSSKAGDLYTVPNTVTSFSDGAFFFSKNLTSVTLPNGITAISDSEFYACHRLTSIVLPSSVEYISNFAFEACDSLTSITIPPSMKSTGEDPFHNCTNLTIYGVPGTDAEQLAIDGNIPFVAITDPRIISAVPSATKIVVNGVNVAVDSYAINGSNYIKLRDLAVMVNNTEKNFNVIWDADNDAINLIPLTPYEPVGGEMAKGDGATKSAVPTSSTLYINYKVATFTAYTIGQNNYFKLRDIMQAFNIAVGYNSATQTATLDTSKGYVAP